MSSYDKDELQTMLNVAVEKFKSDPNGEGRGDYETCVIGYLRSKGFAAEKVPTDVDSIEYFKTAELCTDHFTRALECIYEGWSFCKYATYHGLDFKTGLQMLADDYGLTLNWDEKSTQSCQKVTVSHEEVGAV